LIDTTPAQAGIDVHERALAEAGDAGEHRQPALRDLDSDVLLARAVHADQIVAVGNVQRRRLRRYVRRGVEPEGTERVRVSGRDATLVV
jgi:hypothetical protein